jgi:hypothetical protein
MKFMPDISIMTCESDITSVKQGLRINAIQ